MPRSPAKTPADIHTEEFEARTDLEAEAKRIFGDDLIADGPVEDHPRLQLPPMTYGEALLPLVIGGDRQLHRKLAEVMGVVERIPKNGKAPAAMGGFPFVQVGDAAAAIRKELAARHITLMPVGMELVSENEHESRGGGVMTTQTLRVTWQFVDGDTGEQHIIQSFGTGADRGDKSSPKAQTNAMKYALLMAFLMPTGDDPELEDTSDRHKPVLSPVIESSDPGPVKVGGRQESTSQAQIMEIGRFAKRLGLDPTALAAVLNQVVPGKLVPDFAAGDDRAAQTKVIGDHLKTLTHEETAEVIRVLMRGNPLDDGSDDTK